MVRWEPDARERLKRAALELFAEQGFAATTVPEITARAGLTTRTFFRHFADKREVIFGGEEIPALARQLIADAPAGLDPMTVIIEGLRTVAEARFEGRREAIRLNRDLIRSDPGLGERDLRKRADLAAAIRDGFVSRGVAATTAALLAESTVTVLHVALEEWLDQAGGRGDAGAQVVGEAKGEAVGEAVGEAKGEAVGEAVGEVRPLFEIMVGVLEELRGALSVGARAG